ncbi:unnamed protein product [Vitrella brassicaformis CCMP3155]|uniref:Uncharacterized protein n=1 Tax=Vitrella brassicaformis (strain CCMP3155) TaxID=1169540 RepID=A0A0G4GHA1_VITBC|nr:unnamed protein product [Vitrella brassicaformis CCMP3155]|eukprot:CEM29117.1 unnamed protein product [Vitrella brassicaformis CCMP3155]
MSMSPCHDALMLGQHSNSFTDDPEKQDELHFGSLPSEQEAGFTQEDGLQQHWQHYAVTVGLPSSMPSPSPSHSLHDPLLPPCTPPSYRVASYPDAAHTTPPPPSSEEVGETQKRICEFINKHWLRLEVDRKRSRKNVDPMQAAAQNILLWFATSARLGQGWRFAMTPSAIDERKGKNGRCGNKYRVLALRKPLHVLSHADPSQPHIFAEHNGMQQCFFPVAVDRTATEEDEKEIAVCIHEEGGVLCGKLGRQKDITKHLKDAHKLNPSRGGGDATVAQDSEAPPPLIPLYGPSPVHANAGQWSHGPSGHPHDPYHAYGRKARDMEPSAAGKDDEFASSAIG